MNKPHTLYLRFRKRFKWLFPSIWRHVWQYKRYCARYPEKVREDGCIDANDLCWLEFIGKPELHDKRLSIDIGFEPDVVVIGEPFLIIPYMNADHSARGQYEGGKYDEKWRKPDE